MSTTRTYHVQESIRANGASVWLLFDGDFVLVKPVTGFLRHLEALNRSPNTLRAYTHDLKQYRGSLHRTASLWNNYTTIIQDIANTHSNLRVLWGKSAR